MMARTTARKASLAATAARRAHSRRTATVLGLAKNSTALGAKARVPLATRFLHHTRPATSAAAVAKPASAAASTFALPRRLVRPKVPDVDMGALAAATGEDLQCTAEYLRNKLVAFSQQWLAAVSQTRATPPKSTLQKEVPVALPADLRSASPTHMLAVFAPATPRAVTLFPTHALPLHAHCSRLAPLPSLPSSQDALPVVPLCLPSPETFAALQVFLYMRDAARLRASLVPAPGARISGAHIGRALGMWRNACALGVVDDAFWGALERAWEELLVLCRRASVPA